MNTSAQRTWFRRASSLAIMSTTLALACHDDTPLPSETGNAVQGTLVVTTITTGGDPDRDGFDLIVDRVVVTRLSSATEYTFLLPVGNHAIELGDVAANCRSMEANPRTVSVAAEGRAGLTFTLDCPHFGMLEVKIATDGPMHDADGYVLNLDGVAKETLSLEDYTVLEQLRPGIYNIMISSVPGECSVEGGSIRQVLVPDGGVATLEFRVTCVPRPDDLPGEKLVVATQYSWQHTSELFLLEPTGTGGLRLIENPGDAVMPEFSPNGESILFLRVVGSARTLVILDRVTRNETILPTTQVERAVWSPDGSKILFVRGGRLYRMSSDGTGELPLTTGPQDKDPYWSPDGSRIAFTRNNKVYVIGADGTGLQQVGPDLRTAGPWSPDSRHLVLNKLEVDAWQCYYYYYYSNGCTPVPSDLVLFDTETQEESALTDTPFRGEWSPAWSTDGQGIFFISAAFGNSDIFRIARDGGTPVNLTASSANESWVSVGFVQGVSAARRNNLRRP